MDWLQVLTIAGSTLGTVWFMHRENLKMYRDFAASSKSFAESSSKEVRGFAEVSSKETKDFHGRLCVLEERYFQIMQRIWEKK